MMRLTPAWLTDPAVGMVFDLFADHEIRAVGGCVRDALLGIAGGDIDLATSVLPQDVMARATAAGLRVVPTGLDHGTVTVISAGRGFEVTTLRRDVATDGRRAVVAFSTDWAEDAQRRDFTLNALYMDRHGAVSDPTGQGIADARAGRVVFIGDAASRIREDYLRILRFFRFTARFATSAPDAVALAACGQFKDGLTQIAAERIGHEIMGLLASPQPQTAWRAMADCGVLSHILPAARPDIPSHLPVDALLRLASVLPDAAMAADTARRLRLSRPQAQRLQTALGPWGTADNATALNEQVYRLGVQTARDRAALHGAAEAVTALLQQWSPPVFPLGGDDARALGIAPGPAMGAFLARAEAAWITAGFPDRDAALALARDLLN